MEIIILIAFLIIFLFMYEKDKKDRERVDAVLKSFTETLTDVITALEKTNNKFYEWTGKIEIAHFKHMDEQMQHVTTLFDKNVDKMLISIEKRYEKEQREYVDKLDRLQEIARLEDNAIEKENIQENPLEEMSAAQFAAVKHVGFEGSEEIYPIGE